MLLCLSLLVLTSALPTNLPLNTPIGFQTAFNPSLHIAQCYQPSFIAPHMQLYRIRPGLDGASDTVSFEQVLVEGSYVMPMIANPSENLEPNRFGTDDPGISFRGDASFRVVPGLSNSSLWSFQSVGPDPNFRNGYMAYYPNITGYCPGLTAPDGILLSTQLADLKDQAYATWAIIPGPPAPPPTPPPPPPYPPPTPVTITVDVSNVLHKADKKYMGCHSDTGYVHQARGFYSQMIVDNVFIKGVWYNNFTDTPSVASITMDSTTLYQSLPSLKITCPASACTGRTGVSNRGLGNEGLVFEGQKDYEGYFFAMAPNTNPGASVSIEVGLHDYQRNVTLARQTLALPQGDSSWTRLDFTLTPSASTGCIGIWPESVATVDCGSMGPEPGHICVQCMGEFYVALVGNGTVNFQYFFLQPGKWGRLKDLPVITPQLELMKQMGVTAIRQGGSFTDNDNYAWKLWRGPPWLRPSMSVTWNDCFLGGWGPFEMIDMCSAAGIEPVITLSVWAGGETTAADMADLVEYCYGNQTTQWGLQRHMDGHAEPYHARYFELGNEQYNYDFAAQVRAMEQRSRAVGSPQLYYIFPDNSGPDTQMAQELTQMGVAERVLSDIHDQGAGGVEMAEKLFESNTAFQQGAVNLETNAASHVLARALEEAWDMGNFWNTGNPRVLARTASFCTERSGHFDGFDQGLIFFLPNMTWGQPPFWVHAMLHESFQPVVVNSTLHPPPTNAPGVPDTIVYAAVSEDFKRLVVRYVNPGWQLANLTITISGMTVTNTSRAQLLHSDNAQDANTPAQPMRVLPIALTANRDGTFTIPPQSFLVVEYDSA